MPTLNWIGKKAVINHDRDVPFHLLQEVPERSFGDRNAGNLLIQGDNLIALKSLLPYYAGRVKCIYIDPPYNTGNEGWVYNDNVNDPEIKAWINQVVGREAEDLSRHDKWLCMMYPRLKLLRDFLRPDGFIFISIDIFEVAHLKSLMDEIFGLQNFRNCIAVRRGIKNVQAQFNDLQQLALGHEYILLYSKNSSARLPKLKTTHDEIKPGKWDTFWRGTDRPTMRFKLFDKEPTTGQWRWEKQRTLKAVDNYEKFLSQRDFINIDDYYNDHLMATNEKLDFVRKNEDGAIQYYVPPQSGKLLSDNWMDILLSGSFAGFDTEKNVLILERIIQWMTIEDPNAIILDSFAGSGTTAHAVLTANAQDAGHRRFIMIEMLPEIAEKTTAERLKKVVGGYREKGKSFKGAGGGFRYYRLGIPLFDEYGNVFGKVSFSDLAKHVFFSETGSPLPDGAELNTPFIGAYEGRAIYLLYNGILKDRNPRSGNVLTREVLSYLPEFDGPKVVYGTGCRLSAMTLRAAQIEFKQIPYELKR